jgi:hypothetical protein
MTKTPLIPGTPGIDLKLRSGGAAGAYGLTAWTEAGWQFLAAHVLSLPDAVAASDAVWFPDTATSDIKAKMKAAGLRCVAGVGAEPDEHDLEGFNGWGAVA